jgi:hypothetical protein
MKNWKWQDILVGLALAFLIAVVFNNFFIGSHKKTIDAEVVAQELIDKLANDKQLADDVASTVIERLNEGKIQDQVSPASPKSDADPH